MVMLPSNAIEFDLDGEQYIGIIEPYSEAVAAQMLTTPAVFPTLHGVWMMMTVKLVDEWIANEESLALEREARDGKA
jgi:hypothetical protein